MRRRQLIIFLIALLLSGCGVKEIDLSENNKNGIPAFSIDDDVAIGEAMFYGNKQAIGGAVAGVAGALVGMAAARSEPQKIQDYLKNQKIDVGDIIKSEFERQLHNTPRFAGKIQKDAKMQFKLSVVSYGLQIRPLSFSAYKPSLNVKASLLREDGTVVWEQNEWIANSNSNTPSYTYNEYFSSPETFKTALTAAAQEVIALLIDEMD